MISPLRFPLALLFGLLLIAGCRPSYPVDDPTLPEVVDFNFHVKPILSDRCFACHGPDANKREADLRLDQPESAVRTRLESGKFALVPGSIHKSQVFHRITSQDPDEQMPPPESNLSLTQREIALLAKWIEQGAEYKDHWSLIPVSPQQPPTVNNEDWMRNPIDQFILASLEEKGWTPNGEADKETLLRRITLDLTGLPPTIEEIDAFLDDKSENAYEEVVDRLLQSDAYAEQMALEWMDIARYADSHGYSQDGYRYMWPWRDWVIQAFKDNLPFDQFVTWQLAGDLLPSPSQDQRLATAFLRNQRINSEGGIVPAEYLVEYAVERTATVGTAFMGLTFECARCHDHKYDPISQKEFYQFYAYFNNVNEAGLVQKDGNSGPQLLIKDAAAQQNIDSLNQRIVQQHELRRKREQELQNQPPALISVDPNASLEVDLDFDRDVIDNEKKGIVVDARNRNRKHGHYGNPSYEKGDAGQVLKFTAYDGITLDQEVANFDRSDPFSFQFDLKPHPEGDDMVIFIKIAGKNEGYRGYMLNLDDGRLAFQMISAYPANLVHIRAETPLPMKTWTQVGITYDGSGKAAGLRLYVNGRPVASEILFDQLSQTIRHSRRPKLRIGGKMQEQLVIDEGFGLVDDFRIYQRELSALEIRMAFDGSNEPAQYDVDLQRAHFLAQQDDIYRRETSRLQSLLAEKNRLLDGLPGIMVMDDLPNPRPAFVLARGQYDAPGERVFPDTPEFILPFPSTLEKNRMGIAQWLLHEDHPLTARVTVNRYWQKYFGKGLVATPEDFGSQGTLPTHPALLDWLAHNFREANWDIKAFQKLIVMSATYRQSSAVSPEKRRLDPANDWLARGPSYRLSAEVLRDQVLAASGLLVRKIGGPSVKPYQPAGLWSEKSFFSEVLKKYEPSTGADLYRRSMYTFWRRTAPPPSMILFDAPTRDHCTVRRQRTNTPLQALVLLNDPQFVEAARVLAARMLQTHPGDREKQVLTAFRLLSGQKPTPKALQLLLALYDEEEEAFNTEPAEAQALIQIGEAATADHPDVSQLAALTVVCNTLMSFDEVVMKR